jgi:hypothetical protein
LVEIIVLEIEGHVDEIFTTIPSRSLEVPLAVRRL